MLFCRGRQRNVPRNHCISHETLFSDMYYLILTTGIRNVWKSVRRIDKCKIDWLVFFVIACVARWKRRFSDDGSGNWRDTVQERFKGNSVRGSGSEERTQQGFGRILQPGSWVPSHTKPVRFVIHKPVDTLYRRYSTTTLCLSAKHRIVQDTMYKLHLGFSNIKLNSFFPKLRKRGLPCRYTKMFENFLPGISLTVPFFLKFAQFSVE